MSGDKQLEAYRKQPSLLNEPTFEPRLLTPAMRQRERAPGSANKSPAPAPKLGGIKRDKFNSTATIFLNTMIRAPDTREIVKCLTVALAQAVEMSYSIPFFEYDELFSEEHFPLGDGQTDIETKPDIPIIHKARPAVLQLPTSEKFLSFVFEEQELSAECAVMAFAYIDRLVTLTGISLHARTWRRIVLGALVVASKVWEDLAVWNVDFLDAFPGVDLHDLNRLERAFLKALQYTVMLKASVYAKYYFELRALSDLEDSFPMKPINRDGAERLENKSAGIEAEERRFNLHARGQSESPYSPSAASISLEDFRKKKASSHKK